MLDIIGDKKLNINLDSDGILSFLFLKLGNIDGGIGGYNNSSDLILSVYDNIEDMWRNEAFIDIYSPKKGVITIDQHIISNGIGVYDECKINPHILIEEHRANDVSYFTKYPYSTCMFILAILEREKMITSELNLIQPLIRNKMLGDRINLCDMILRADGVLYNSIKYRKNCKEWAEKLIEFSDNGVNTRKILDYLFSMDSKDAEYKFNIISDFYVRNGLEKDGGFNGTKSIEENISIINNFMKAFATYLNIDLKEVKKKFYHFEGERGFFKDVDESLDANNLDTYAFVGKAKLSYTIGFKPSFNFIELNILE